MRGSWAAYAACSEPGVDPELFFPLGDFGLSARPAAAAMAICARCPVRAECLDWALRVGEPAGIWGGTTPDERRRLRHAARTAARDCSRVSEAS